jgi:thiamine pyrophosphokinase
MQAFIFVNGEASSPRYYRRHLNSVRKGDDLIICADGGYRIADSLSLTPNLLIGDLDSVEDIHPESTRIIRYPREKDSSDFELALRKAEGLKPERVYVYGALGGRPDHLLVNLVLLAHARVPVIFQEESAECRNVPGEVVLEGYRNSICSLVPLDTCVVSNRGFKYPLDRETIGPSGRGLSNLVVEEVAAVTRIRGTLVLMLLPGRS